VVLTSIAGRDKLGGHAVPTQRRDHDARRLKPKIRDLESTFLADSVKLRGVDIERLGYYGGPAKNGEVALAHTLDNEELEPLYDTEAERATAERQARLLAGCL
jgi:hypothetical protein